MRSGIMLGLGLGLLLLLSACGKRPPQVDAPEGTNPKAYPQNYPDTRLDPAGTYKP